MYVVRRKYLVIRRTVVLLQAHIRGKLARTKFQQNLKQKHMRERQKLRSTQSLPVNERSVDIGSPTEAIKRIRTPTPHYSLDADIEISNTTTISVEESPTSHLRLTKQKRDQMLDQTEQQIRDLLISKDEQYFGRKSSVPVDPFLLYQSSSSSTTVTIGEDHNDVLDIGSKKYDVEKAMRKNSEDLTPPIDSLKRFDITKMPIRRVDSGPSRREIRYDPKGPISALPRPQPATDVEIVFVNSQQLPSTNATITSTVTTTTLRSSPYNQQYSQETVPHRRDLVRSMNEVHQPPIVYHQPPQPIDVSSRATISGPPPKGKLKII
jgi:hypothetical protein